MLVTKNQCLAFGSDRLLASKRAQNVPTPGMFAFTYTNKRNVKKFYK